ncbi:MAG TPA: hypothetical protein VK473_00355 [Terriglobales bacterium]|nr:hypothetical protein [Terriglobales bacterium]
MKKHTLLTLLACGLVTLLSVSTGFAQITHSAKATIPFDFAVGDKNLPAGPYLLSEPVRSILWVANSEENARAGITTSALYDDGKGEAKLVFHKVGERYFLSQVWMDNGGIQVPMSRQEKGLLAQHGNGSTYAVMTVALSPIR